MADAFCSTPSSGLQQALVHMLKDGAPLGMLRETMKHQGFSLTDPNLLEVELIVRHGDSEGDGIHTKSLQLPLPMTLSIKENGKERKRVVDITTDVMDASLNGHLLQHILNEVTRTYSDRLHYSCMICKAPDRQDFKSEVEANLLEWMPGLSAKAIITMYWRCASPDCYVAVCKIRKTRMAGLSKFRKCYNPKCFKTNVPLKTCSGCEAIKLCSSECQRDVWDVHKPECKRMRAAKAEQKRKTAESKA